LYWIIQLSIIATFLLIGNLIVMFLHIPLPGSVMGLILLLALLVTGNMKLEWINKVATFQLKHLSLFFIPLVIGVFLSPNVMVLLKWNIILVLILSSISCLLGTAYSVEWYEKLKRRRNR
jgi:holin-like protein